jgi:hypothetical protein
MQTPPFLSALRTPLTTCLTLALGLTLDHAAIAEPTTDGAQRTKQQHSKDSAVQTAITHYVDTCADDGSAHSLRTLAAIAGSGDTIDLSQLPMSCSTITVDHTVAPAFIAILQDSLSLIGPSNRIITIDGDNYQSSIFRHFGGGKLSISNLTLAHGKYIGDANAKGGCVYSKGDVDLTDSTITNCAITGNGSHRALGGGIYLAGNLYLLRSRVSSNSAHNIGTSDTKGGGVTVVGEFKANYSTISNNVAYGNGNLERSVAGGVYASGAVDVTNSTVAGNKAESIGGLDVYHESQLTSATIANSTISGNYSSASVGGLYIYGPLELVNSTVAFNRSDSFEVGGVYLAGSSVTITSSIVANNSSLNGPYDIGGSAPVGGSIGGAGNLIVSSAFPTPADTITDCPRLEPLSNNGGRTLTHALRPTSPAIDKGIVSPGFPVDQRGASRVGGPTQDIGAFEWHGEPDERIFVSGFDGLCDQ